MYKSPIELIYKDVQNRMEKDIFYAIQKVDIKVDRDELLKALAYDRGQYEKGYEDAKAERKKGKWLPYLEEYHDMFKCSNCGNITRVAFKFFSPPYDYCPYCGADMREEKTNED